MIEGGAEAPPFFCPLAEESAQVARVAFNKPNAVTGTDTLDFFSLRTKVPS